MVKDLFEQVTHSLIKDAKQKTVSFIISRLSKKIPLWLLKGFNPVIAFLVDKIIDITVKETELRLFYLRTTMQITRQGREYLNAIQKYEQNKSEENLKKVKAAFKNFVIFS